jgi:hypothetical protein
MTLSSLRGDLHSAERAGQPLSEHALARAARPADRDEADLPAACRRAADQRRQIGV